MAAVPTTACDSLTYRLSLSTRHDCAWCHAGSAHLIAIASLATRLAYVRSSRVDRFKLTGLSWWLHLLQATAAAACLLITLFLLNGRLATSRASLIPSARARGVSPYEWVGERRALRHMLVAWQATQATGYPGNISVFTSCDPCCGRGILAS